MNGFGRIGNEDETILGFFLVNKLIRKIDE
jgi:hypothetical protein